MRLIKVVLYVETDLTPGGIWHRLAQTCEGLDSEVKYGYAAPATAEECEHDLAGAESAPNASVEKNRHSRNIFAGRWGVKQITVATGVSRWYTNEAHSQDDAIKLAASYNKPSRYGGIYPTDLSGNQVRYEAALIQQTDNY